MDGLINVIDSLFASFADRPWVGRALASVLLVVFTITVQLLLQRFVRRASIKAQDLRRRWLVQIRNVCLLIAVLGLVVIWATEIRTLAISLVAFLVALVLATKEIILCVLGGLYKVLAAPFVVGDRIRVSEFYGEVIDQSILTTQLMELSPTASSARFTGRLLVMPNALLLTQAVRNENLTEHFTYRSIEFPLKREADWQAAEQTLLEVAQEVCGSYLKQAQETLGHFARKRELDAPAAGPVVKLELPDADHVVLVLRVPVPVHEVGATEQAIIRAALSRSPFKVAAQPDVESNS